MNVCIVGVVDKYFRIGLEHILIHSINQLIPNENIIIYGIYEPCCDVVFIDIDNLSVPVIIATLKSIKIGVMVFIIATWESKFQLVNLALNYKGIYLYKREQVNILKGFIKSKIASNLFSSEQYEAINIYSTSNELTHNQNVIINLILRGLTVKDISVMIHKSEKAISAHKRSAMKKLGVTTNHEFHELRLFESFSSSFDLIGMDN